jgi:hypothetical protein
MNASICSPSQNTYQTQRNGVASRSIYKRRSPRRSNPREINYAYVDSQILQRPTTVKQTTPSEVYDASYSFQEFDLDAYASNEDLIRRFVSTNA